MNWLNDFVENLKRSDFLIMQNERTHASANKFNSTEFTLTNSFESEKRNKKITNCESTIVTHTYGNFAIIRNNANESYQSQ